MDVTSGQLIDRASNGTMAVYTNLQIKIRWKCRLMCGGLVMVNERDSRVAVVRGCFSEGGDSIQSAFSWEPLQAKLQDT